MQEPALEIPAPKRKLPVLWIAIGTIVAALGLFLFQLFGPNPPIIISKQTTFITEPLGEDGLPDYEAYLLQRGSEGVTPENNAAIPFWKAMWPGELEEKDWLPVCNALGMPEIPSDKDKIPDPSDREVTEIFLVDYLNYLKSSSPDKSFDFWSDEWQSKLKPLSHEVFDLASTRPWLARQLPSVAEWIEERKPSYDLLVNASRRPKYHSPSPTLLNGSPDMLWAVLVPDVQMQRHALRALKFRAMLLIGENRGWDAWSNLLAAHRLARHTSQSTARILVAQLVGIAIDTHACHGTQAMLHHCKFTDKQLLAVFNEIHTLSSVCDCSYSVDNGERLFFVDTALHLAKSKPAELADIVGDNDGIARLASSRIDWNTVMRDGNRYYDKLVDALNIRDRSTRLKELQTIESELLSAMTAERTSQNAFNLKFSVAKRSKAMGFILIALLSPAAEAATSAEDRANTQLELTKLAAALAVYRAEQGEYPEKLEQLVPSVIAKLPVDLYSGKSFIYQRKDDGGYLLYSVFENEIDDGGTDLSGEIVDGEYVDQEPNGFDSSESDLVVRMPVPKFEFPDPPSDAESEFDLPEE